MRSPRLPGWAPIVRRTTFGAMVAAAMASGALRAGAVTRLPSADGQYWDIQDTSTWAQDSGAIATGGGAMPFNGFGYLKLRVTAGTAVVTDNLYLTGFGLVHDGGERVDSLTPVLSGGIVVARELFAPRETDYLRYLDTFTNVSATARRVDVAWGGAAGAYEDGGLVTVAATSSGDRRIDAGDWFVTVMQNARRTADPLRGPSGHGPSAHVLGNRPGAFSRAGDMYGNPFDEAWPGYDPAHIGYVYSFTVAPGATVGLMTFVVKGLSEVYDPRGGAPVPIVDGLVAPKYPAPYPGPAPVVPAAGSEIARVTDIARRLASSPDLRGLTRRDRAAILNWALGAETPPAPFTVFERTAPELADAMARGETTSVDIVHEYLRRLAAFDRNGPRFRAMLALSPAIVADARRADAARAAGAAGAPLLGVPVAFKDNIDATGMPATGGARALVDYRPARDAKVVEGMRRAGAIVLGKTNLDEFPFGDFGISSVGGTIGNAFDPSLSTAGSSGGTAVAVSSSLVTLGFGTDTCNSLSNPAAFASLATIRTTRGLTSRAGVMPLNPFNDAVGPIAKSVRELAMVMDAVTGPDPDDEATAEAAQHGGAPFVEALRPDALKGARVGVMRQLFVGVTGEREAAGLMDAVRREIEQAGATVIDVAVRDLDARYHEARGAAPGALKAAWERYLAHGARAGQPVLTIQSLIDSGKLAPAGARRLAAALEPTPTGEALRAASDRFLASRLAFRQAFVDVMDQQHLDVLLYPANQARPSTHDGGLERYDGEPGTCEESAMTGLPQVTVPAGFLGGRYPFGISYLGRMWDDRRVLAIAYSYEQATHHRRAPGTVK